MTEDITVRRGSALPFVQIPTSLIRDVSLSIGARLLYAILCTFADLSTRDATLKRATLGRLLNKSVDTVDRYLDELVKVGLVVVQVRKSDDGRTNLPSVYTVHTPDEISRGGRMGADTPGEEGWPHQYGGGGRMDAAGVAAPVRHRTRTNEQEPTNDTSSSEVAVATPDPVAEALCVLLADLIEANGSLRPTITKKWLDAARLMISKDKREPEKAANLIRWCQADEFWRANIMSMPKFRQQYDVLRQRASSEWERRVRSPRGGTDDRVRGWLDLNVGQDGDGPAAIGGAG